MINKIDYFLNYNKNAKRYTAQPAVETEVKPPLKPLKELLQQQPVMQPLIKPLINETNVSADQISVQPQRAANVSRMTDNVSIPNPVFKNKFTPKFPLRHENYDLQKTPQSESNHSDTVRSANQNSDSQDIMIDKNYTSTTALWPTQSDNFITSALKQVEIYNKGFSSSQNSIDFQLKKYFKKYSGQTTAEAKNEARDIVLNLNNGYWITDEKMDRIARELLDIQNGKNYVKLNLDEDIENDGENTALKQVLNEGMAAEQQIAAGKYENEVKDFISSGKTDEKKWLKLSIKPPSTTSLYRIKIKWRCSY